jgi:hypothetical protein
MKAAMDANARVDAEHLAAVLTPSRGVRWNRLAPVCSRGLTGDFAGPLPAIDTKEGGVIG